MSPFRHVLPVLALLSAPASALADAPTAPASSAGPAAPAGVSPSAETSPGAIDPSGQWRGTRWGMTPDEVLAALHGEARRMEPPITLADGTRLLVEIPEVRVQGEPMVVRFVFGEDERLRLVSLRNPPSRFATPEYYEGLRKALAARFGGQGAYSSDDNFIDLRQVNWTLPKGGVQLKYVPGVAVILYHQPAVGPLK